MKKKLLAILSLVCSAVICATAGTVLLTNNGKAFAAGELYTKTVNGKTYTFEKDFNNITYSGLGQNAGNLAMATEDGVIVASHGNNAGTKYTSTSMVIKADNSTFTRSSSAIAFQFNSLENWKGGWRLELCYGDLTVYFTSKAVANQDGRKADRLCVSAYTYALAGSVGTEKQIKVSKANNGSEFAMTHTFESDNNTYKPYAGWTTVYISKNKCTAIDGDSSAATGYWLTIRVQQLGKQEETLIHDGYVNAALYTDTYDSLALGNASGARIKFRDLTSTYTADKETCVADVGDFSNASWKAYATAPKVTEEQYLYGKTISGSAIANNYKSDDNAIVSTMATQLSIGLEFRIKENCTKEELAARLAASSNPNSAIYYYLNVWVGSSLFDIYLDKTFSQVNIRTAWLDTGSNGAAKYVNNQTNVMPYEVGAEYAVKVMRIAVNPKGGSTNRANGSITRVYMGKVDPSTGMPAANWDKVPVYEYYFAYDRQVSWNSLNKISIRPGDNTVNHSMTISSNKYCAVKTDIKGEQKLHKVARGSNVDLVNFINLEESEILIGWSKGASTYSADDFVASKVYENIQTSDPTVYKALTMKLAADKKASLKFRQRKVDGQYLPMEASLKWNVTAEDNNNLATYFGGIKFGYKLSANGKSMEAEVSNLTNGYTAPYSYSVIQSNIDEASWGVNFTCQAYVEFAGVKYYSEAPASEDGRSVSYVANAAANDLKVAPEGKYLNEIVDEDGNVLGYSYLTQKQYDLVARIAAAQ